MIEPNKPLTRMQVHAELRKLISSQTRIATDAKVLGDSLTATIDRIKNVSPNILRDYDKTDVELKKITTVDESDMSGLDTVRAASEAMRVRVLDNYNEKYARGIDNEPNRKSFAQVDDSVELTVPPSSLPYHRYDQLLKDAMDIDLGSKITRLSTERDLSELQALTESIRLKSGPKATRAEKREASKQLIQAEAATIRIEQKHLANKELYQNYVDSEVFNKVEAISVSSHGRARMRKYLVILAAVAGVLAAAAVAVFIAYAQGVL